MHRQSDTLYEDAMIAATAKAHGLTVVTRNVADFKRFGVPLLNPFRARLPRHDAGRDSWHPLLLSLKVASVATVLALALGLGLALPAHAQSASERAALLEALFMLPLVLPPTVIGFALLHVLGRNGWVGGPLLRWFDISLIFTWPGAGLRPRWWRCRWCSRPDHGAGGVDGQLVAAARTLGQPEADILIRIVLPLAWPGILAGCLLAFARAMGSLAPR